MKSRRGDWRLATLLFILLAVPPLSHSLMDLVPIFHQLELVAYDWHCTSLPVLPADPRLVYIGMDDASLQHLGLQNYPLPRRVQARLVDGLREAGARVIGFDAWFTQSDASDDKVFAAALARQARARGKTLVAIDHTSLGIVGGVDQYSFEPGLPTQALRPYVLAASIAAPRNLDRVRSVPVYPADAYTGARYLQMPVALAASYWGIAGLRPVVTSDEFSLGPIHVPVMDQGETEELIRYAGPSGTFVPIPYWEVYTGAWKTKFGPNFFRDKIVLIGRNDVHEDRQDTPWHEMAGTEILLDATQTLLQGRHLEHWGVEENFLLNLTLCWVLIAVVFRSGMRFAFFVVSGESLVWIGVSHQLFLRFGLWADTVEPIGALIAVYMLVAAVEARRMRLVFHRFMPASVAEQMLRANVNQGVATAEREATVVFCDVRDFTTMSETLPLEVVEEVLHRYFIAGEIAARHFDCEIDKFVGDEIMLFFEHRRQDGRGRERRRRERRDEERRRDSRRKAERRVNSRPVNPTSDRRGVVAPERRQEERRLREQRKSASHAVRAVLWALEMQEAARELSRYEKLEGLGFRVGIGICTGVVRIGTVGARHRIQHTVIGDTVNTASRLQDASKRIGHGIVLSESTWRAVRGEIDSELLGEISVKGKQEPLRAYGPTAINPVRSSEVDPEITADVDSRIT